MKFQSLNVFYQKKFNFIKFNGKIILKAIQQALIIQTRTPNLQAQIPNPPKGMILIKGFADR